MNVIFTQMQEKKAIKLLGGSNIAEMIKEFNQLYEGAMPVNIVVIQLNPDELTDSEKSQALKSVNLVTEKILDNQGKNLRKWDQEKRIV